MKRAGMLMAALLGSGGSMRVLVIDNYDSFTYNLVQYLGELGSEVQTVRNDRASVDELLAGGYERCVISPGPCTPDEAGISLEVARRMPEAGIPTLGVCLGHQGAGADVWGKGGVARAGAWQGRDDRARRSDDLRGLSTPLAVGRYHSLVVDSQLPDCLEESGPRRGSADGVASPRAAG